ncbi:hypothetical protein FVR03_00160 [Pontibacter qinzhouensis]|uniref:Phosphatase PAP2 family protein n=1 Tax=Pontibacter qinzhouensis TaxID=2603253 RepID=A0A5C8KEL1_9BACT|nr:hypothetical protein [Pontibacter qinzhouensis]TXK52823.1 hypothetical protein FVR03_00160 [Pontibacter qinzhouensis]
MSRSLARLLSVVFHPLLLPTYLFAFLFYYLPAPLVSLPLRGRWVVLSLIFFTTFIIPGLGAYTMVRAGHVDSLEMDRREQRSLPLLFTGVCYVVTAYLLHRENIFDRLFFVIMVILATSVFLAFVISLFWKISAHSIGVGGALGLLLVLSRLSPDSDMVPPLALTIFIAGAVLSARLSLHVHTPAQVYAGFGSGLLLALTAAALAL